MFNKSIIFIILALIAVGIIFFLVFYFAYKKYLGKRLKTEGKIRNFPQPLTVILFILLAISFVINVILAVEFTSQKNAYNQLSQQQKPNSIIINDLSNHDEYTELKDALINGELPSYEISKETQGDFELIVALPNGKIGASSFMPQYIIYINYTGDVLEDFQMERHYYHDEEEHGFSGVGSFKPETLFIGNELELNSYIGIKTIIKIAPETSETKNNWDSLPVYKESYFTVRLN